jgi:hypothetical protein
MIRSVLPGSASNVIEKLPLTSEGALLIEGTAED